MPRFFGAGARASIRPTIHSASRTVSDALRQAFLFIIIRRIILVEDARSSICGRTSVQVLDTGIWSLLVKPDIPTARSDQMAGVSDAVWRAEALLYALTWSTTAGTISAFCQSHPRSLATCGAFAFLEPAK